MAVEQVVQDSGLDLIELLSRVEGDYDLLRDIVQIFNREFPKSYGRLISAVESNDFKQLQVSAHTLRGMFSTLSFVAASACARRIELMARVEQCHGIGEEVACLKQTAHVAQASLQRACRAATR